MLPPKHIKCAPILINILIPHLIRHHTAALKTSNGLHGNISISNKPYIYVNSKQTNILQGLSVTLSNRSSLIPGSPAPMAMKEEANLNRRRTRGSSRDISPSPTITLSQYWDENDEKNNSDLVKITQSLLFKC